MPDRLRLAAYRPFIDTIRAAMAHGGGLRIDHVLGLFRQWWVPDGADPGDGAYVSQPTDELLAVLAIEAERAGAVIIGEDLGTVAPGVRRRLAAANVLSTRLAYFERLPPRAGHERRWPASPPTTCRPWPAPGPAPTCRTRRALACSPIGAGWRCSAGGWPAWPACNPMRRWPA